MRINSQTEKKNTKANKKSIGIIDFAIPFVNVLETL